MGETTERPILFSKPMVLALLAGRKTVTRRIVKPQPEANDYGTFSWPSHKARTMVETRDMGGLSPFGAPGDRLWVKESCWLKSAEVLVGNTIEFGEDIEHTGRLWCGKGPDVVPPEPDEPPHVWYAADGELPEFPDSMIASWGLRWERRNSIHMPRWASRITLVVTGVRVERLHDITEADARAEGVTLGELMPARINGEPGRVAIYDPIKAFAVLWDSLNRDRAPWSANPWLWVVSFSVLSTSRPA